ncbi:hypothetical protein [Streptomyces sp. NPDC021096]
MSSALGQTEESGIPGDWLDQARLVPTRALNTAETAIKDAVVKGRRTQP